MNDGRRSLGNFASASVICSIPGILNGCERILYGKFGLMQLEVTNESLLAAGEPGLGAVTKAPVLLLDNEYLYCVAGFRFLIVTAAVKSELLSSILTVPSLTHLSDSSGMNSW